MTKDEITQWVKTSKHVVTDYNEYDSNDNHYARDVFEKDGELWSIEYVNGQIMDHVEFDKEGNLTRRGFYEPRKVRKICENITRYEYILGDFSNN